MVEREGERERERERERECHLFSARFMLLGRLAAKTPVVCYTYAVMTILKP